MGIELDTKAIERRLEGMIQKIDHFKRLDVGAELSHWQTEDMHRHRPFTMRSRRAGRAATIIRPHSLYEMKGRRRFARRTGSQGALRAPLVNKGARSCALETRERTG
jgi:hypothetical protein